MIKFTLNTIFDYSGLQEWTVWLMTQWGALFSFALGELKYEGLVELHEYIMFYLIIILFGVGWILTLVIRNYASSRPPISYKYLNDGILIEPVVIAMPALILIAFLSFNLLKDSDLRMLEVFNIVGNALITHVWIVITAVINAFDSVPSEFIKTKAISAYMFLNFNLANIISMCWVLPITLGHNVRRFTTSSSESGDSSGSAPIPVKEYQNADLQKKDIVSENKNKSGVYCWTNNVNGKRYIGSSIDISNRMYQYYSLQYLTETTSMAICRALLKYGYSSFSFSILEYCDKLDCLAREKYYIDKLKPEYNISQEPGSPMFGRKHSFETKDKMSVGRLGKYKGEDHPFFGQLHSEETKLRMSIARKGKFIGEKHPLWGKKGEASHRFGKTLSSETKEKLSSVKKGKYTGEKNPNYGKKHSVETREKISLAGKGEKHPLFGISCSEETKIKIRAANGTAINVFNTVTGEMQSYSSMRFATVALSCSCPTISKYLASGELFKGIYKISRK